MVRRWLTLGYNALFAERLVVGKDLLITGGELNLKLSNKILLLLFVYLHDVNLFYELIYSLLLLIFIVWECFNLLN